MTTEKYSPWKSFYYSIPEKQSFVMSQLDNLQIPYRETENGFEAQECHVEQIRKLEKEYKASTTSYRETLRNSLDKIIMQSRSYDEVLQRLRDSGCQVKCGKYIAVKSKIGTAFIRLKSLGENYSEQAIKNRLTQKLRFESAIDNKIAISNNTDSLETITYKTIKHYTIVFAAGVLPVRKKNKKKFFSWENCEELDKLAEINKKINCGLNLSSLRNDFARLEKSVFELEETLERFNVRENPDDFVIHEIEKTLHGERIRLYNTADTLSLLEKVVGGTFVQSLIDEEKQRQQSDFVKNGLKSADNSLIFSRDNLPKHA